VNALAALDAGRLASGGSDHRIHVWSLAGGVEEMVLEGHTDSVLALAALHNGLLASGSVDKTVRVWDVGARVCVAVLEGSGGKVRALAALPDGRLASGSQNDPLIRVWALAAPGSPEDAAAAAAARCVTVAAGAEVAAAAAAEEGRAPEVELEAAGRGLPVGWSARRDAKSGRVYYLTKGGSVQWERPAAPSRKE
jgi:hypothetical protein